MKKSYYYLITIIIVAITIIPIGFSFWKTGMFSLIDQVMGPMFWVGIIGFIILMIFIVNIGIRIAKNAVKPKTLKNGLPATATVIRSYQGNINLSIGVNKNFQLIIEINVTNPQGETWQTKMVEMINLTQVGLFQPGFSFKVLYDPMDKNKVVFDQSTQPSSNNTQHQLSYGSVNIPGYGTVNSILAQQAVQNQPQNIVLKLQANNTLLNQMNANGTGILTDARVLERMLIIDNFMQGVDVYQLKVEVNAKDRNHFQAELLALIQKPSVTKIAVGNSVYVKYNPNNILETVLTGTSSPDTSVSL